MWFFFEPLDVLLFRTPGPFTAGESHVAESFFPPNPPTLMGAIRAAVLHQAVTARAMDFTNRVLVDDRLADVRLVIGGPGDYGRLRVKGPLVAVWDEQVQELTVHLPRPRDLLASATRQHEDVALTAPLEEYLGGVAAPGLAPLWSRSRASSAAVEEATLTLATSPAVTGGNGDTLAKYLRGELRRPPSVRLSDIHETEARTGIMLNRERTAQDGFLYHADFSRLAWAPQHRVGLLCHVTGLEALPEDVRLPSPGCLPLGGERRSAILRIWGEGEILATSLEARLKACRETVEQALQKDQASGNGVRFSVYLLTAAVFRDGWQPDFVKNQRPSRGRYVDCGCEWKGLGFRLVGGAVGKPTPVGGWDLFYGRPKPLRRAVPSGSVYRCILEEGSVSALMDAFWFESIMEDTEATTGMGLTLIGRW